MTMARDTTQEAAQVRVDILRTLEGPIRLEMACQMSDEARDISGAGIRHRHPEWNDEAVHRALLELLLGPDLARRVLQARRAPT